MYDFSTDDGLSGVLSAFESGGFAGVEALYSNLLYGGGEPLAWGDGAEEMNAVTDDLGLMGPPDSLNGYNYLSPNDGVMGPPSELAGGDISGLLKTAESWLKANPNLTRLGLSGLAGLAGAYQANRNGQNSIESLREQEAIAERKRQRISDSITGMVPFAVNAATPLTRTGGERVFGQGGRIAR